VLNWNAVEGILLPSFQGRIFPVNQSIADRRAVLYAPLQRKGRQVGVVDGLIAATAIEHGLTIVTRDVNDFSGFGVTVFNPWET